MLGTTVVGGNLSRGPCLSLTTTVVGETSHALPRSGARIGDRVGVVGALGLAAAGLGLLQRAGARARAADRLIYPDTYSCLEAFRRPRALVEAGLALAGLATAALDVSDGLAIDGERLAQASGVRLVLDAGVIAGLGGAPLAHAAAALGTTPLALALHGGEDYALLFTAPRLPPFSTWLGDVTNGPAGLVVLDETGEPLPLPAGFAHFD
jgi:thiamine-monophosphate kinase